MAKASTKEKKNEQSKALGAEDIAAYARLRVLLDGFDGMALYYFYEGNDPKERKKRVKQIEKRIKAFQDSVKTTHSIAGCPPGWCECDGVCVPPPCGICPNNG